MKEVIEYLKQHVEVVEESDGSVSLNIGDEGMDTDLWFASSAVSPEDPMYYRQRELLQAIAKAVKAYNP